MNPEVFSQHPYRCRLEWGRTGAIEAAARGDIMVIVDTLSFSTAAATAVHYGGIIYPCSKQENADAIAQRINGEVAVHRQQVPEKGRFSLSPLTYLNLKPGTRIVLPSLNGATCSSYGRKVPYLFVGTLLNAQAVAIAVSQILAQTNLCATIIACGERWQTPCEDGMRVAIEDYLAAGAIVSYLQFDKSPEARIGEGSFLYTQNNLQQLIWECGSGRELREIGFSDDVLHAAQLNLYDSVPVMQNEYLITL